MLYVIVAFILLLVLVIGYGAWMRRKRYSEIDQIETRRIDFTNRPVAGELAKLKQLKLTGETEKKFEKWRSDWDNILTAELPAVEEQLFTAEELTDKYRFGKAEQMLTDIRKKMDQIEKKIDEILKELHAVVDSERKNRKDIVPIKESYHQIKKNMITKRSQFKQSLPLLEKSVRAIDERFQQYHKAAEEGNYIKARQELISVKDAVERVERQMDRVPDLYQEIDRILPEQLKELRNGAREMDEEGYSLEHLQVDGQLDEMEKHLAVLAGSMKKLELDEAEAAVKNMHEQLDLLFAQMEREVASRQQVRELAPAVEEMVARVGTKMAALEEATHAVRESYHIGVDDLKMQRNLVNACKKQEHNFAEVRELLLEHRAAFSSLLEKLGALKEDIGTVEASVDDFDRKIKALRKDELAARDNIQKLRHSLFESRRIIQKSNIPGVPHEFADRLKRAGTTLSAVNEKLDEKPLDMAAALDVLKQAEAEIDDVRKQADHIVETADLAEEMIRYGNRYRSDSPEIEEALEKAEMLFRNFDYDEAVETAVRAVEKKEPKILKRTDLYRGQDRRA